MAYSDLRRNALLKVETDSDKRRALSQMPGGLLKAFLFVQTVKSVLTGSKLTKWRKDTPFAKNMPLSLLIKHFLE